MIRLLNVHTLQFKEFHEHDAPAYAIASHRWQNDEATFKDVLKGRNRDSAGFAKIRGFCDFIKSWKYTTHGEIIDWLWIDTCCIDKKSSAELSEAINSMYGWYADAEICIAYLFDVQLHQGMHDFEFSEWFKRDWTLQELIAPPVVPFTDCEWRTIGHKKRGQPDITDLPQHILGPQVNGRISRRTGISEKILLDHTELNEVSYETRLSWMNERHTTRVEGQAYCLLGIFDIYMPLIYGERQQATRRLLHEVLRRHLAISQSLAKQINSEQAAPSGLIENSEGPKSILLHPMNNLQDRIARLEAEQSTFPSQKSARRSIRRSVQIFSSMLSQYNDLRQQTLMEEMELQKAKAFWNPLESISERDRTD